MKITLQRVWKTPNLKSVVFDFWLVGYLILGVSSFTVGQEIPFSASAVHPPEWLARTPESRQGLLFFVGIHSGALVLENGRDAAITDAASQIAAELGMTVSTQWISEKSELAAKLIDDVRIHSNAQVSGQRVLGFAQIVIR